MLMKVLAQIRFHRFRLNSSHPQNFYGHFSFTVCRMFIIFFINFKVIAPLHCLVLNEINATCKINNLSSRRTENNFALGIHVLIYINIFHDI
jgi:hypothetical protein